MQDTFRVRVHGCNDKISQKSRFITRQKGVSDFLVPEHNQLYIKILEFEGKYFNLKADGLEDIESENFDSPEDYLYKMTNKEKSKHGFQSGMMVVVDEHKVKKFYKRFTGSYRVPSSFGGVTFQINKNAGYIDFELSIPKYLYGHSLAEFIAQPKSSFARKNFQSIHDVNLHFKQLYKRFMHFLDRFFLDLCHRFELDTELNKKYIEITRIDFCKNQYFKSNDDAMEYLRHLQDMNVRRYKNNANVAVEYNTSLTYAKADGSYFKIYGKGAEYVNSKFGDLKIHEKINMDYLASIELPLEVNEIYHGNKGLIQFILNKIAKSEDLILDPGTKEKIKPTLEWIYKNIPFKTDFFKTEMDRVLRYELSIKNTYMSSLYKRNLFRRKDTMHRISMLKYKETKKKFDARYNIFSDDVSYKEKRNFDMVNNWLNRTTHFMLETNSMLKNYEDKSYMNYDSSKDFYNIQPYPINETILRGKDVATFSPELFKMMFREFWKEVKFYQVENVSNFDDLVTRIKAYNNDAVKNANSYNELNSHLVRRHNAQVVANVSGLRLYKKVKKATQLLTQKELTDMGFKKVSVMHMVTILREMEKGKKLKQIFVKLGFSANQRSRFKKDLKLFGITEQSVMQPKKIDTNIDFRDYYELAGHRNKIEYFYVNQQMARYD